MGSSLGQPLLFLHVSFLNAPRCSCFLWSLSISHSINKHRFNQERHGNAPYMGLMGLCFWCLFYWRTRIRYFFWNERQENVELHEPNQIICRSIHPERETHNILLPTLLSAALFPSAMRVPIFRDVSRCASGQHRFRTKRMTQHILAHADPCILVSAPSVPI